MTMLFIFLNNLSLIVFLNYSGFLKWLSLGSWFITIIILWSVIYHYIDSDFYRNLGKEQSSGAKQ